MKFDYANKRSRPVVKIRKEKKKKPKLQNRFIDKDTSDFRPPQPYPYPVHQKGPLIEEYFYEHYNNECPFHYLPIFWTSIYMGMTKKKFKKPKVSLQTLMDSLDKKKQYFTIVQSDLGITENVPDNVLIFGAGGEGHIPIPLLCDNHTTHPRERDIFASFVGVIDCKFHDSSGIRHQMRNTLLKSPGFYYKENDKDIKMFEDMMNRSIFALCPRGYGKTSFRMYEAIQMGCIPVYVYDNPWLPYKDKLNWEDFSVLCHADDLPYLSDILHSYSEDKIERMQYRLNQIYSEYFSLKAVARHIIRMVNLVDKNNISIDDNTYGELIKSHNQLHNKNKKITFAIPAYNEFSDIHPGQSITKCLQWPLHDDRVDEIIISDDCSDHFDKLQNLVQDLPKVKLYRNESNLGTFGNKKKAVSLSSNDWVVLFDSDNSCDKTYIDNLYDTRWDDDTIYHPVYAMPKFDHSKQSGEIWTVEKAPMLINRYGRSLLNMGNFFFNKNMYMQVLRSYPYDRYDLSLPNYLHIPQDIRQDFYWRLVFDPDDAVFVFKEWLFAGNKVKMLQNQQYDHLVSDDSTCIKSPYEKPDIFSFYMEELLRRKKFVETIEIMEYLHDNCWDKKHPDYDLCPWDFFKVIYNCLLGDNIVDITQIGCFSLFVPKIINRLMIEKPEFNYHIYHPTQDIDIGVFGYADECCPDIHSHNLFDNTHSDILIIEDDFDSNMWHETILSFCKRYHNDIIYICDYKKKSTNLYSKITMLSDRINTLVIKNGTDEYIMVLISPKGSPCWSL